MELLSGFIDRTVKVEILPKFIKVDCRCALVKLEEIMAEKVWEPLKDTLNLVIDLCFNSGGSSTS